MSQMMQYRGYKGSVLYSAKDKIVHGKLQGVRDFVTYDGEDLATIERSFHGAVDEYLAFCEAEGKTPDIPLQKQR